MRDDVTFIVTMHKSSLQGSRLAERRYKQLLEEEQASLARNKKLLEDIDRLEEEMKYFSLGFKQDEEKLNQAKNNFMHYVKSVYPQWTEDVKKWKEVKRQTQNRIGQKGPFSSSNSELYSTQNRDNDGFTNYAMSPASSVPNGGKSFEGSLEYPRRQMKDSRGNARYSRTGMAHPIDMNGSSMDQTGYSNDPLGPSKNVFDYSNDRLRMGFSQDRMGYSSNSMAYHMNIPRSFRDTKDLSWDEMGLSRGYPGNDIGYPRMYNGGSWMFPQNTPPGGFSHPTQPFFAPMPVLYGGPRWSTPGYDYWFNPWGRNYEDNETDDKHNMSRSGKEFSRNESFTRNGREMQSEVLSNSGGPEYSKQMQSSHNAERFSGQNYFNCSPGDTTRQSHYPSQRLEESNEETECLKNRRQDDDEESRTLPQRKQQDKTLQRNGQPRVLPERSEEFLTECKENHQVNGKMNEKMVVPKKDRQENHGAPYKEELTDRTTISEHFVKEKGNKRIEREYIAQPVRDTRLMQLRSEGRFGSGEAMNTDSISLPTIHQYEGDPRDIFTDISDSEPLNASCPSSIKPKKQDHGFDREALNQGSTTKGIHTQYSEEDKSDSSDVRHLSQADSVRDDRKPSQETNHSDISHGQPLSQDRGNRVGSKHFEVKEYSGNGPKDSLVEVSAPESDRRFLKLEASESKSSVVEDLIGDNVSDLEISEAELSGDGVVGNGTDDITGGVGDQTDGEKKRMKQGNLHNENLTKVRSDEILGGVDEAEGSVHSNKSTRKHQEAREHIAPTASKKSCESLGIDDNNEQDGVEQEKKDKRSINDGMSHSIDESIPEDHAKTDMNVGGCRQKENALNAQEMLLSPAQNEKRKAEKTEEVKADSFEEGDNVSENQKVKTKTAINRAEKESSLMEDSKVEPMKADMNLKESRVKLGESVDKKGNEEMMSEDDEKSKSGLLEEISFSSVESTSESVSTQEKNASMKSENKVKESVSYIEDFEDDKSIPLTQSAAYQKMLSTVDVSDEEDYPEEGFLEGTLSEANTTGQSAQTMSQTFQDSGKMSQINPPVKPSSSKPTLSLFNGEERDDFKESIGNDGVGVLSPSWKSNLEGSLSPPLSPERGGYVPTLAAAEKKEEGGEAVFLSVNENKDGKVKTEKKLHESDTKSRIQAGFWNNSESESEIDLQISHGGNDNNDDDGDFDFYS